MAISRESRRTTALESREADRPKISVCMASFNGERFIAEQMRSILDQLSPKDELIVVDDHSGDRTRTIIGSMGDKRIQLIEHELNQGIVVSFEEAIRKARGEFIFLSDQDDVWLPSKVSEILAAFESHQKAMVVVSDASRIGDQGQIISSSNFRERPFRSGLLPNLLYSRFVGCTMAFRSVLKRNILPFPSHLDVLHDIWIGTRNSVTGGKTVFIGKPLMLYRRHAGNFTGTIRLSRKRQLRVRFHLLVALISFSLRKTLRVDSLDRIHIFD